MEEKERYVIRYDLDYNQCLIDTEENQGVGDYIRIVKLLNQQDKEIKRLKANLKESENYIEEDEVCKREYYQKVDAEDRKKDFLIKKLQKKGEGKDALIEQLQAENKLLKVGTKGLAGLLKSQAKEIVEEVEKNFTEYLPLKDKTGAGFYSRLNAILKKYGGADEN